MVSKIDGKICGVAGKYGMWHENMAGGSQKRGKLTLKKNVPSGIRTHEQEESEDFHIQTTNSRHISHFLFFHNTNF